MWEKESKTRQKHGRGLTQAGILTADLTGGLENVHLNEEMTPDEALATAIKRM